jgi:raffinose/stachyose/melibiose transport system permease protein
VTNRNVEGSLHRQAPPSTSPRRRGSRYNPIAYLFVAPALLLYLAFVGLPIVQVFAYSFLRWSGGVVQGFAGINNYLRLVGDPVFWVSLLHNLIWVVLTLVFPLAIGLLLSAILVERSKRTIALLSAAYFLPRTIPFVVSGIIWGWIYNPIFGLANWVLEMAGLPGLTKAWLAEPSTALYALNVLGIWTFFGFCVVIYLAALQSIEPSLHEAAMLDGATWWQRFVFITVPMVRGTSLFLGLYAGIEAMRFFDIVWVTTSGGPGYATEVLTTHIYKTFFLVGDYGYAAATSVILLLIVIALGGAAYWRTARA